MPITKCPRCDRMFNRVRSPICLDCEPDEEKDYEKVQDIVLEVGEASAEILAERAEVDRGVVMRMLDRGMLTHFLGDEVKCGRCGRPAISAAKKLCERCLAELDKQVAVTKRALVQAEAKKSGQNVKESVDAKRR